MPLEEDKKHPCRRHKTAHLRHVINSWFERLFSVMRRRSRAGAEEVYEPHQTRKDYIWNSAGLACWGLIFPLSTIIITQLLGAHKAGMFSLAFVVGNLLLYLANFGVRPYQSSDRLERHSFLEYQIMRLFTCLVMLLLGIMYCHIRNYDSEMFNICFAVFVYRAFDALSDVYEGRLQQMDKLYLAGVSQALRSAIPFVAFVLVLVVTRSVVAASCALAVFGAGVFVLLSLPLTLFETPKSTHARLGSIMELFKESWPLFCALFLYTFIDNMPKFAIDGILDYSAQLYFNALYFPAQAILLCGGFIYKPLIVRMTELWAAPDERRKFDQFVITMNVFIAVITLVMMGLFWLVGIAIMSFLYGVDFEPLRLSCMIMLAAGGLTGGIDFFYQVCAIIRHQKIITRIYLVTFALSLLVSPLFVYGMGLEGACVSYLLIMLFLYALLLLSYIRVRLGFAPNDTDPQPISVANLD